MKKIEQAATVYRNHVEGTHRCPECGSGDEQHEDNGEAPTARNYTLLCTGCGAQWMPNDADDAAVGRLFSAPTRRP